MAQYKITTLFTTQGSREYYMEAESANEAVAAFNKELVKNSQAKETIYAMTEDITDVMYNEAERVDIDALKQAEADSWSMQMSTILNKTRKKLRDKMGFGISDEPTIGQS